MQAAIPSGEDAVGSGTRHADMLRCRTGPRQPQLDIVDIETVAGQSIASGRRGIENDVTAATSIVHETHRDRMERGDRLVAEVDGVDRHKAGIGIGMRGDGKLHTGRRQVTREPGDILGDTYNQAGAGNRTITTAGTLDKEVHLQAGDVNRSIQARQGCPAVVIPTGSHIESYGVLADIRMCCVRPAREGGWHRTSVPAGIDGLLVSIRIALEVLSKRQVAVGQRWTLCLDAPCLEDAAETWALGSDSIAVEGVADKGMKGVEGIGDSPYGVVAEDGCEAVVAFGAPHQCHRGVGT